jgi:hypothetical protein
MRPASIVASLGLLLFITACGEAPPPPVSTADDAAEAAEKARFERAQKKIAQAEAAAQDKDYDQARELLAEARKIGVESQRYEIAEAVERIDKRQAKALVTSVQKKMAAGECEASIGKLAASMRDSDSEAFQREVRRLAQPDATKCVQAAMDEATQAGNLAGARKLVNGEDTKLVLGPTQKKIAGELDATVSEVLRAQVEGDLKAKKWGEAAAKLDAAVKKGEADEAQAATTLEVIRAGLAPDAAALAQKSVGQRDAVGNLAKVDALIKVGRWEVLPPESAKLAPKGSALPEDLARKREALAVWAEAQRLRMQPSIKPEKRWTHGKVPIAPATKQDGESKRDLKESAEVWIIGKTKTRALIAETEPTGSLPQRIEKATGWVALDRLAPEPTENWLPPDDQLKDARVWAPLHAPEPLLELGTVSEVKGDDVAIKRVTDDQLVTVPKKTLRAGRLEKGMKVLQACAKKEEVGVIEEVTQAFRPSVKVKCSDGVKEETLAALRTRPDLLPPTKQRL